MSLVRYFALTLFILSGCAGPQAFGPDGWSWPFAPAGGNSAGTSAAVPGAGSYAQFSFDWQLSGDPEIMPAQVFDDGVSMWLQFPPEGVWPAVFDVSAAGWRPLSYRREPPYMVLDGIHELLELRGGHLRGSVRRVRPLPLTGAAAAETEPFVQVAPSAPQQGGNALVHPDAKVIAALQPDPADAAQGLQMPVAAPLAAAVSTSLAHGHRAESGVAPGTEPVTTAATIESSAATAEQSGMQASIRPRVADYLGAPVGRYTVSPADHTIRQALERWARTARWTFSAEHWAVDVDIPLVGEASFETDFKSAVRELLTATEMGDRPLQPCFYSNRVLRVVPYAQACDRRGGTRAVS